MGHIQRLSASLYTHRLWDTQAQCSTIVDDTFFSWLEIVNINFEDMQSIIGAIFCGNWFGSTAVLGNAVIVDAPDPRTE